MNKLNFIYFDGKSLYNDILSKKNKSLYCQETLTKINSFNMEKIDSIEFRDNLCDIKIKNINIPNVNKKYLILRKSDDYLKYNLYPDNIPSPDPGGLY